MKKAAEQKTTKRKKTPGEYGLQLVSHRSEAGANRAWAPISTKFRTLLAGKEPVIEMATVKGKQYYRLKVGPYYDKRIAVDTCKQLVLSRQDCLVSDYYGEPF
jgi:cell division protein FtsN